MPLKIRDLGYTLAPGERFADQSDCVEDDEVPELETYAKSEINRENEIRNKIKEIRLKPVKGDKEVPWLETLTVVGESSCDPNIDINHSLKLEEHFKDLSSSFVVTGLKKLEKLKVPFNRPSDFYAEMIKSDEHMNRIMKNLERKEKQQIDRKTLKKVKKDMKQKKFKRKLLQSQERNKFIKNVNLLKKKHKGQDIDKQIDKLISSSNSNNTNFKKVKKGVSFKNDNKMLNNFSKRSNNKNSSSFSSSNKFPNKNKRDNRSLNKGKGKSKKKNKGKDRNSNRNKKKSKKGKQNK